MAEIYKFSAHFGSQKSADREPSLPGRATDNQLLKPSICFITFGNLFIGVSLFAHPGRPKITMFKNWFNFERSKIVYAFSRCNSVGSGFFDSFALYKMDSVLVLLHNPNLNPNLKPDLNLNPNLLNSLTAN